MKMVVEKYVPDGLYGFLSDSDQSGLFFHLSVFDPGAYIGEAPVPPIVGEAVEVSLTDGRVSQCNRIHTPVQISGEIDWFSDEKGYGFITGPEEQYFLHRAEVLGGRLPLKGRRVSFYVTEQERKPLRACYVTVEI